MTTSAASHAAAAAIAARTRFVTVATRVDRATDGKASGGETPAGVERAEQMVAEGQEHVCLDMRRHGVVLAGPLSRAVLLAVAGSFCLSLPWPVPVVGALLTAAGAVLSLAAVVRWDRTRIVVTSEKVFLVHGVLRRRASAVLLRSLRVVSLEQTIPGRVLGYGTLQAGPLEVEYVPRARQVRDLVERLAA